MRKRSVTLVELLIGCSILAVLLTFLFGLIREIKTGEKALQKEREKLQEKINFEAHLDQLFLKITPLDKHPGFYTDSEGGLVFTTKIGANFDPLFVDRVLCRLYCSSGELIMDQFPDPVRHGTDPQEMRREILLTGVTSFLWSFFTPPKEGLKVQTPAIGVGEGKEIQEPVYGDWIHEWKIGYQKIPPLLRLDLQKNGDLYRYETYLPATSFPLEISE